MDSLQQTVVNIRKYVRLLLKSLFNHVTFPLLELARGLRFVHDCHMSQAYASWLWMFVCVLAGMVCGPTK
jgi:hypothetical protein